MRVTYLKLENVAGINVGQNTNIIEIDFVKSSHRIISIQAKNAMGKSTLISSIHPFATVTSLDERSSLPYIVPGKQGSKEIHYELNDDKFVIKHYFKPTKERSHTVKSYISRNGEELNENGNVTSFLALVEIHFGITPEMMRLIRLGSNVQSFVGLKPADRKNYIGRLIDEIDLYLQVHRKVNDDLKTLKVLISTNGHNLQECHISDPVTEREMLMSLQAQLKQHERERDGIRLKISKLESLEKENNAEDLKRKRQEAEASILTFQQTESEIERLGLHNTSVDQIIGKRGKLVEAEIGIRSKINSLRMTIDSNLSQIDRLGAEIKRISSNGDVEALINIISELKTAVTSTSKEIANFQGNGYKSEDVNSLIIRLSAFNQISAMIHSFGTKALNLYFKLRSEQKSVDSFVSEQMKRRISTVNDTELKRLFSEVFQEDYIISPNCDTEFKECPYYRFSTVISQYRSQIFDEVYDEDVLRYLRTISLNVDAVMNEIERLRLMQVPEHLKSIMNDREFLNRLENKLPFFDISIHQDYLSRLKAWEIYQDQYTKLREYEHQLSVYRSAGVDHHLSEIEQLRSEIGNWQLDIKKMEIELDTIQVNLRDVETQLGLLTTYNDGKKYQKIVHSTLESTNRLLEPLESAESEKRELRYQVETTQHTIDTVSGDIKKLEQRLDSYERLVEEGKKLSTTYDKLNVIMNSVSTKKGIPLIYMNTYLGKIQSLTNSLLSIVYGDELVVGQFNVTADEFEIPFIRNGTKIPDVRYASQSELSLITMALSFALAYGANQHYNILLLDEIDAGLDEQNRLAFLRMLDQQMTELKSDQAFVISHNINSMMDLPLDVIRLSDIGPVSKLQNVIYE